MIKIADKTIDKNKTNINKSELIYGQSFIFISGISILKLSNILDQISIMKPFVDKKNSNSELPIINNEHIIKINKLILNESIQHIAKEPSYHIDIYSDYILPTYDGIWKCETWIRGNKCEDSLNIIDNKKIEFENVSYSNTQDHSKYACNDKDITFIGDLNRMKSQDKRGGGGFIIKNNKLTNAIRSIMI